MEWLIPTKIYFKHRCKYHNVFFPVQLLYANKIILQNREQEDKTGPIWVVGTCGMGGQYKV
jgi:hypothetical protein